MAKFTLKEFANTYNYKDSTIKSWIHRGQLQKDADGKIDTENDKNKLFLMQNQAKNKSQKIATTVKNKEVKNEQEKKEKKTIFKDNPYEKMELEKKKIELEKLKAETRVKEMQAQRLAGLSIPTELAENIIITHNRVIYNTFWGEIETLINIICPEKDLAIIQIKKMREFFSILIKRSSDDSLKAIENLIEEFSNKN